MRLYEIDQAILNLIDPETGEILDWEAFADLKMEKEQKIENMACWIKNLDAEAKAIRQEEIALADRRRRLEDMVAKRKEWLKEVLDGQKFETPRCSVNFRRTTRVELIDEMDVIEWAHRNDRDDILKYAPITVNKTELGRLLKDIEIPGAQLVSDLSMGVK